MFSIPGIPNSWIVLLLTKLQMGARSGDPRAGGAQWEDMEEEETGPQCQTQ